LKVINLKIKFHIAQVLFMI